MTRAACGTYAAYQQHIRRGERPDHACKRANAEYNRAHRHEIGSSKGYYLTVMERGHLTGKLGDFW
jgi:hypothetical protein